MRVFMTNNRTTYQVRTDSPAAVRAFLSHIDRGGEFKIYDCPTDRAIERLRAMDTSRADEEMAENARREFRRLADDGRRDRVVPQTRSSVDLFEARAAGRVEVSQPKEDDRPTDPWGNPLDEEGAED